MRYLFFISTIFASIFLSSCGNKKVSMKSLLHEMTDREVLTRLPEHPYTLKQFSSYDRTSTAPDDPGWFANEDYTQFIREEENNGRREFVLFDAEGPGAVVRWWMTFAGEGAADGTVRIYIDNQPEPAIEGDILELLSGEMLASEPLAASVSPETEYRQRGHNLYLPLPYNQHCKITYECDAVRFENNRWRPSIYYNICYRTYQPGVEVESITSDVFEQNRELISATGQLLLADFSELLKNDITGKQTLAPGESLTLSFEGSGKAVSYLTAKLESENLSQALRSTVLSISFDGEETVWIPVGEFFGTGYQIFPSKTWYTKVSNDGKMESFWLMPFKENVEIEFINYGEEIVTVDASAGLDNYKWKKTAMYFGAAWHEHYRIHTATNPKLENHEWHFDVNYVDLKGRGVYVGDAITVFNTADAWWGEGDEKIFVDGEEFPSFIGTGTEDYYGYAWCRPEKFTHPFIAQPTGAGNFHPGMTVNMRYRTLDAIPFQQEISSNIEMWHWVKTTVNFAMSSYWYALPGAETNVKPDVEAVQNPVALDRSDIYPPVVDDDGKIEGEHLEVMLVPSGTAGPQSGNYGWNGDSQLWWRHGETGDELLTRFILDEDGRYNISAQLTKAPDYGIIQLFLNGLPVGSRFNGFHADGVITEQVKLGTQTLIKGEHILSVKIIGADANAKPGNMAGIDWLQFEK
ncbi:MAG: DUF2961 domain-containing protein [Mariniphaga sp.]|nr:DUF2961 domain-containing protein [Mariniphaga sp.]